MKPSSFNLSSAVSGRSPVPETGTITNLQTFLQKNNENEILHISARAFGECRFRFRAIGHGHRWKYRIPRERAGLRRRRTNTPERARVRRATLRRAPGHIGGGSPARDGSSALFRKWLFLRRNTGVGGDLRR